ncbi:hypothetical protein BMS3Bbin11_01054 [bacterium BMS3Bbin11]|nr:hypothetical protein BMS3Abin11_01595 [bacterium BMS3Abin11]GBE45961.1 hypothetical protein BMS3Bbin11_01054 [bacterium BMS3Bbin11]GMT39953.1 MAG: hypothetical protein IEMM0001_0688 [bacterium]HDH16592.1 DUF2782 domain-containing protein [Gammaproteobacteria bacterium]
MRLIKAITTPASISSLLALIVFSVTAAIAGAAEKNGAPVFSSEDVDPALIDENLEPEIKIQQFDNREVQEYSINNHVYMIKITPKNGFPYYLVDPNGTGEMEYKRDTVGLEVNPPQWTLFRW